MADTGLPGFLGMPRDTATGTREGLGMNFHFTCFPRYRLRTFLTLGSPPNVASSVQNTQSPLHVTANAIEAFVFH